MTTHDLPGADGKLKEEVENYQLSLNENGEAPNQTRNFADAEDSMSRPLSCRALLYVRPS